MPLNPRASVGENIKEFESGPRSRHTAEKFGKDRARKQAIAVALKTKREAGDDDDEWRRKE